MATRKLPAGFGKTLKALIAQGHKPKDAMREAWKLHKGTGPGMKRKPLTNRKNPIAVYNPRRKVRARRNVPQPKWKMLYGDVIEIRAIKTTGEFRGQPFKHKFATRVLALGLPNGTVLLEAANRSRLWDYESNIG